MAEQKRKSATILAMDVVSYSAKMSKDEAATVSELRVCQEIIEQVTLAKDGRIFNTAGDSFMIEFTTTIGALETAIQIQEKVAQHNEDVPNEQRLEFRMGVNMGDVTIDGENLLGDGVNIAARLEGIAPPAGICISEAVYSTVKGKLKCSFIDKGTQNLKNIEDPVRVYFANVKFGSVDPSKFKIPTSGQSSKKMNLVGVVALVIVLMIGYLGFFAKPGDEVANFNKIAVLPLESINGGAEEKSLAVGLSKDLGSGIARSSKGLVVVALNEVPDDVSKVGNSTGAKYIVSGNVRQAGTAIRVGVTLIDATDLSTIWTDTYDREMDAGNIFALQDEIVSMVVNQLVGAGAVLSKDLNKQIGSKGTENLTAYECVNYVRSEVMNTFSAENNQKAIDCLKVAVASDPSYAEAWIQYAAVTSWAYSQRWGGGKEDLKDAANFAEKAISLDPEYGAAHAMRAEIAYYDGDWSKMYDAADKALDLSPGDPTVVGKSAWYNAFGGDCTDKEISDTQSPRDTYEDGSCRWHKGCWELGLRAHQLDGANYDPWDNYLLCNCYNALGDGQNALKVITMVPAPGYHWWDLQTGIAHHLTGNTEDAKIHLVRAQQSLGSHKLTDLYPHFQIWNMHEQIWPIYEPILKKYGFI